MKRQRRQRGATLLEVMLTLAIVLIGMLVLFKVLVSSMQGSAASQRITQGQKRVEQVMEAILTMPQPVLACLAATPVGTWNNCEAQCVAALGATASPRACVFTSLAINKQDSDGTKQRYVVVDDAGDQTRSTWVRTAGGTNRVYDVQITIGWNDNGQANPPAHRVTARAAVFK